MSLSLAIIIMHSISTIKNATPSERPSAPSLQGGAMGRSSGQRVCVHNHTPFVLHKVDVAVVCGESKHHPTEITPATDEATKGIAYLQNNGNADFYGSEIVYTYRISNTPDKGEWLLRIFSIGAYKLRNACFTAQILWRDSKPKDSNSSSTWQWVKYAAIGGLAGMVQMMEVERARALVTDESMKLKVQISWRDPRKHHDWNPNPDNDKDDPHCPFTINVPQDPQKFPEEGSDFYKVDFRIGMKPADVNKLTVCKEILTEETTSQTIEQTLLPGGQNSIVYENYEESYKCVKRKVDDKWGRAYKFTNSFEWGVNAGAEQKVKAGDEKGGTETTVKAGFNIGGKHSLEVTNMTEHLVSNESTDTVTQKQVYKWSYTGDVKEKTKVLLEVKKKTYRQDIKWKDEVVGYKERYAYEYKPSFV